MRGNRFVGTGVLLLLLGATAPIYAEQQDQNQQQDKGKQQQDQNKGQQQHAQQQQQDQNKQQQHTQQQQDQNKQQHAQQQQDQNKQQHAQQQQDQNKQQHAQQQQDQNKQQHAQQQQRDQNKGQQQIAQQQDNNRRSQQGQRVQQSQQRQVWQEHRAQNWQSEHRDWQQRGGYNGYRIPDDRYRGNFGPDHSFRIYSYPMEVYGGYPRFQYGGFWFGFVDPWPEYWSDSWYDNDDVYIVYSNDGYYLYNRRYPRDQIAITVYLN